MRTDRESPHARVIGERDRDRRAGAALGAVQVNEVPHGGKMRRVLPERGGEGGLEGGGEGGLEGGGPVRVE